MNIAITSGKSEGPTKLNAFDNALLDAGIGNVNLIEVSSIVPPGAKIIPLPKFEVGSMVKCVLAKKISERKDDLISASVAVAMSKDFGCIAEHSGVNVSPEKVRERCVSTVKNMMKKRNKKIEELIVEEINHRVKKCGAVVAAVVYIE